MKRKLIIWIIIIGLLLPFTVTAAAAHISDQGDLLTDSEEALLESKAIALSEEYGVDVLILTKSIGYCSRIQGKRGQRKIMKIPTKIICFFNRILVITILCSILWLISYYVK